MGKKKFQEQELKVKSQVKHKRRKLTERQQRKLKKFVHKEESKRAQISLRQANNKAWKQSIDVKVEVGQKRYTEGQKNFIRALKVIEENLHMAAEQITRLYGSDDIEELAAELYVKELEDYSEEELKEVEREFNKTHGYQVRLKKATNPFSDIDFLGQY